MDYNRGVLQLQMAEEVGRPGMVVADILAAGMIDSEGTAVLVRTVVVEAGIGPVVSSLVVG